MPRTLAIISMLFFGLLASCSKSPSGSVQVKAGEGEIQLRNLWQFKMSNAVIVVTEYENTGKTPIRAFKGKWIVYDDFGKSLADMKVVFSSDSNYLESENKIAKGHVINSGEHIVLIATLQNTGEETSYFTKNENLAKKIGGGILPEKEFADGQITKKLGLEVEQIVN